MVRAACIASLDAMLETSGRDCTLTDVVPVMFCRPETMALEGRSVPI